MCATLDADRRAREAAEQHEVERRDQHEERHHRRSRDAEHFCRAHAGHARRQLEQQEVDGRAGRRASITLATCARTDELSVTSWPGTCRMSLIVRSGCRVRPRTRASPSSGSSSAGRRSRDLGQRLVRRDAHSRRVRAHGAAAVEPRRKLLEPVALDELEILLADAARAGDCGQGQPPPFARQPSTVRVIACTSLHRPAMLSSPYRSGRLPSLRNAEC